MKEIPVRSLRLGNQDSYRSLEDIEQDIVKLENKKVVVTKKISHFPQQPLFEASRNSQVPVSTFGSDNAQIASSSGIYGTSAQPLGLRSPAFGPGPLLFGGFQANPPALMFGAQT